MKSMMEKLECTELISNDFLSLMGQNKSACTKSAISCNCYLKENEEKAIVWIAKIACTVGLGLTREDLLNLINEYVNDGKSDNSAMLVTMETVTRIIRNNENSLGAISASSLDPKRAKQANTTMHDAFFAKLELYIGMLYADGKVPWKHFKDIPNECLYNMDELATDTTQHKQKVIGDKQNRSRTFIITPEGDGKMNHHVTICLTSRANGMCLIVVCVNCCMCELLHIAGMSDSSTRLHEKGSTQIWNMASRVHLVP